MIVNRFIQFFKKLILTENSPSKLAFAFCLGVFIAFSPFIFFHTIMTLLAAWYFELNFAIMYAASHLFNNPWTMIPIYAADYYVGRIVCSCIGVDVSSWSNPAWIDWINSQLTYYVGLPKISLWIFIIGGNLLGLLISLMVYPLAIRLFTRIIGRRSLPVA